MPLTDESFDHVDDFWNCFCYARVGVCAKDVHRVHDSVIVRDIAFCDDSEIDAFGVRDIDDFVINIGEIGDIIDCVARVTKPSDDDVEGDGLASVSKVAGRVRCDSTSVESDTSFDQRFEFTLCARARVVDSQYHALGANPRAARS